MFLFFCFEKTGYISPYSAYQQETDLFYSKNPPMFYLNLNKKKYTPFFHLKLQLRPFLVRQLRVVTQNSLI